MTAEDKPDSADNEEAGDAHAPEPTRSRLESNVKSRSTWMRLVYMLIIGICYFITRLVFFPVVVLQFLWVLITGETNKHLHSLSQWLASYTYQAMMYLAYNSDDRPFPFDSPVATTAPADT
ncbi:MAG: DUF4389 domain-containing protein [Gammaproteobacteria bacterium]|nr:DUF4389 domain-containing protein [Gammaproteobacteria bacterium]